jgi:hypothetical protein
MEKQLQHSLMKAFKSYLHQYEPQEMARPSSNWASLLDGKQARPEPVHLEIRND